MSCFRLREPSGLSGLTPISVCKRSSSISVQYTRIPEASVYVLAVTIQNACYVRTRVYRSQLVRDGKWGGSTASQEHKL